MSTAKSENTTGVIKEITPLSERDCFYIADRHKKEFTYPIHKHVECELEFLSNAAGANRVVGDSSEYIGNLDLILITGKDLEHGILQGECKSNDIREITIQFNWDFTEGTFFARNQFNSIRKMMVLAEKGIVFPQETILKVYNQLDSLSSENTGFYSVLKLLTILYELSISPDIRTLSSSSFARTGTTTESRRVNKVQKYINENYKNEIHLNDMADLVNMSPASFSRFFKLRTGRSLTDYITDIRIGHATRMLVDTTTTIAEIGYSCGFNNLSNFNRIFKKKKACSPKEFREQYRKKKLVI
ncbi:MAG: helix-turn-helix domain-containing protein [Bacteroidaceae bacterium]|nr:helix-turn-helix domain-containing protein [Bacteroidaceae bacterium]